MAMMPEEGTDLLHEGAFMWAKGLSQSRKPLGDHRLSRRDGDRAV